MGQVLRVTDGSTTVNLLSIVNLLFQGWSPAVGTSHTNLYERVTDRMAAKVKTSSIDAVAVEILKLNNLLRKAWQFHNTEWQTTPVYLESQGKNETKARFSLIFNGQLSGGFSEHDFVNEKSSLLRTMQLRIEREAGWRDNIPGNYLVPVALTASDGPATPSQVIIANHIDEVALTHIYNFDDSLAAFSNNFAGDTNGFDYFAVSGSTPAAGDIVYFGSTTASFHHVALAIAIAGVVSGGVGVDWEYFNGSFVSLTLGTQYALYPVIGDNFWTDSVITTSSDRSIHVSNVNDWTKTTINGVNAYWIRARIVANTFTTNPTQIAGQAVYVQKNNYIEISSTAIDGDLPPFLMQAFGSIDGDPSLTTPNFTTPSRIIVGARSRGLDKFEASIALASGVQTGFTQQLGTDASNVTTDPDGPKASHVAVSFGTETLVERVAQTLPDTLASWEGTYRVFLRCQQIGGSDGDLSVQAKGVMTSGNEERAISETETVDLQTQDAGLELVDLGVIRLPKTDIIDSDTMTDNQVEIQVWARRNTGSSTLELFDVTLMPIDEWAAAFNSPIDTTDAIGSSLGLDANLEVDAGIVTTRIFKSWNQLGGTSLANNPPTAGWEIHGQYPMIEPSKQYRFYFMIMHYNGAFGTLPFIAPLGSGLTFELRVHNRYKILRGADA